MVKHQKQKRIVKPYQNFFNLCSFDTTQMCQFLHKFTISWQTKNSEIFMMHAFYEFFPNPTATRDFECEHEARRNGVKTQPFRVFRHSKSHPKRAALLFQNCRRRRLDLQQNNFETLFFCFLLLLNGDDFISPKSQKLVNLLTHVNQFTNVVTRFCTILRYYE